MVITDLDGELPAQWMIYIVVEDLNASLSACEENGGKVLSKPQDESYKLAIIQDTAGAVAALWEV